LAKNLKKNNVLALNGELGTGKTQFVTGIVKKISPKTIVSSPTFVLLNEYKGEIPIYHFDVYRTEACDFHFQELIKEYFSNNGICIIEWANKITKILPSNCIKIEIKKNLSKGDSFREITIC
jgi:tRNA threonylcarbamoyladenosine biosynthesis protein TsaE